MYLSKSQSTAVHAFLPVGVKADLFSVSECFFVRHPSGEFSYGNTSVSVKLMNQDGTFLPGELTQDLGYVSTLAQVEFAMMVILIFLYFLWTDVLLQ